MARRRKPAPERPLFERAKTLVTDPDELKRMVAEAAKKAEKLGRAIPKRTWEQVQTLGRMLKSYATGEYREIPTQTIVLAAAALLYFLLPIDAIPDWLAGIGLIDDAGVIAFVFNSASTDIARFRKWEAATGRGRGPTTAKLKPRPKRAPSRRPAKPPRART